MNGLRVAADTEYCRFASARISETLVHAHSSRRADSTRKSLIGTNKEMAVDFRWNLENGPAHAPSRPRLRKVRAKPVPRARKPRTETDMGIPSGPPYHQCLRGTPIGNI